MAIEKFADDGFSTQLVLILEDRIGWMENLIKADHACPREQISKFVWETARYIRKTIKPEQGNKRVQAWTDAKGMLKELVDWKSFNVSLFNDNCVMFVLEKKIVEVLDRYKTFVLTGEIKTKYPPPKLLGETDLLLCVDKPCQYVCEYGTKSPPVLSEYQGATALLNGNKNQIQIHEYLARKFQFETAVGTRTWWAKNETELKCSCGKCAYCSCTQTGCCNRLDRETSGVMIVSKTIAGFPEIRRQFASEGAQQKEIEKYYLALGHGTASMPESGPAPGQGKIGASGYWSDKVKKMFNNCEEAETAGDDGRAEGWNTSQNKKWNNSGWDKDKSWNNGGDDGDDKWKTSEVSKGKGWGTISEQQQLTYYEPLAWYGREGSEEKYTLFRFRIITGRRHQIRFHAAEIGHPLVGDPKYGAPASDYEWAKRMFLHSYVTKFREPFTQAWYEGCSPLPPELTAVLATLTRDRIREDWGDSQTLLARRDHPILAPVFKQYDPSKTLLTTDDKACPQQQPNGWQQANGQS